MYSLIYRFCSFFPGVKLFRSAILVAILLYYFAAISSISASERTAWFSDVPLIDRVTLTPSWALLLIRPLSSFWFCFCKHKKRIWNFCPLIGIRFCVVGLNIMDSMSKEMKYSNWKSLSLNANPYGGWQLFHCRRICFNFAENRQICLTLPPVSEYKPVLK